VAYTLSPIGIIHTPYAHALGTPLQPAFADGVQGQVEVYPEFADGLKDLEMFERIWLLFWCHLASQYKLQVVPYRDTSEHGIFAVRAPARPNPIGLSCVKLSGIEGRILHVDGVDMLDGSPLLDIKPYIPQYDVYPVQRVGWLSEGIHLSHITQADGRFERADCQAGETQ
jgi:tRNA-Thr(GGU) m(6)t(6)A37 methyltransferase TsaA